MKAAKKLCAKLLTQRIEELNEDEKFDILAELEDLDIYLDDDTSSKRICQELLSQFAGNKRLIRYADELVRNDILKEDRVRKKMIEEKRKNQVRRLNQKSLQLKGCNKRSRKIFGKQKYNVISDVSIKKSGFIKVSKGIWSKLLVFDSPFIEIENRSGKKFYTRVIDYHDLIDKSSFFRLFICRVSASRIS